MIVDSSALVAIVKGEADAETLLESLLTVPRPAISAATLVEVSIVIDGTRDPVRVTRFEELLASLELDVAPLTAAQATIARQAGEDRLLGQVQQVAPRVHELSEFLVDVLGVTDVGAYFPHSVTYHPSCHGRRLIHLGDRPYQLLRNVRGMTLVDLPAEEQCCGFGGTFSIKNPDVSAAMAADKARHVRETGAEYVVAGDNSCLLNIGGVLSRQNSGVKPIHLAEILANTEED